MTGANGEVSFINIKTLNEWDSRVRHAWSPCVWFLWAVLFLASLCEPRSRVPPHHLHGYQDVGFFGASEFLLP